VWPGWPAGVWPGSPARGEPGCSINRTIAGSVL
jgi:hypothetical protein